MKQPESLSPMREVVRHGARRQAPHKPMRAVAVLPLTELTSQRPVRDGKQQAVQRDQVRWRCLGQPFDLGGLLKQRQQAHFCGAAVEVPNRQPRFIQQIEGRRSLDGLGLGLRCHVDFSTGAGGVDSLAR